MMIKRKGKPGQGREGVGKHVWQGNEEGKFGKNVREG